jgi:PAS domain S-box-containing protein
MTENRIRQLERENHLLQLRLRDTCSIFEEKIHELSFVREIGLSLLNITDFSQVCKTILEVVTQNTIVQNCSIMLVDHDKDQLFLVAATNPAKESYVVDIDKIFSKEGIRYTFRVGEGAGGQAALTRQPVLIEDTANSSLFVSRIDTQVKIGSLLSIPLVIEDKVIGILNLSHSDTSIFTAKDLNVFSILKNFIALAIHTTIHHEELRYSEQKYRILTENSNDGIAIIQHGKHVYTNPAYQKITGYNHDELAKIPFELLMDSSHSEAELNQVHALLNGESPGQQVKVKVVGNNQIKIELEINSSPITHNGKSAILISARDLTVRRQLELQLLYAQKMEAIATLAGGFAHDFNNILTAIIGYTEMSLNEVSQSSRMRHYLEQVFNASHRARDLLKQILVFSRMKQYQERVPVDIVSVIKEALNLLQTSLPATIGIRQDIEIETSMVLADPTQIRQVLINVCTNAVHAMEATGGVLEITLTEMRIDSKTTGTPAGLNPGHYLRLTVHDTGHGMDSATLQRIFDPYFTTKGVGKGSGLGLALVRGIIERHQGGISVYSKPGKGTVFSVYLPIFENDAESRLETDTPVPKGNQRILFADDECDLPPQNESRC